MFDQVTNNLQKNRAEMADLQNQAATLKKVNKPSDDPLAATRVLAFRTEGKANAQFLKTASQARSFLDYTDQSLNDLSDVLVRAKELVLGQVNDASGSGESRRVVAEEMKQLFNQSVQIGNRKLGDRYLFGGYKTTEAPFDFKGNYKGDDGEMRLPINKDTWLGVNIPGSKVFLGKQKLDHEVGDETVVEPKSSSEIIQAKNHEEKIKMNNRNKDKFKQGPSGGPAVRGPASVRTDSISSLQTNQSGESGRKVDGQGLSASEVRGQNVFDVLDKVYISLKANDKAGLQDSIDDLDNAFSQVIISRAELGARVNTLDSNVESLRKMNIEAKEVASQLEDADQFEVISDITKTEGTLKATIQTSGKLIQPSLLDFLR